MNYKESMDWLSSLMEDTAEKAQNMYYKNPDVKLYLSYRQGELEIVSIDTKLSPGFSYVSPDPIPQGTEATKRIWIWENIRKLSIFPKEA